MTPEDQHLDRRAFIKVLAGALGGFVREYRAGLGESSAQEQQELTAVEVEVGALNDSVQNLAQATDRNQQAVLDTLQRIIDQTERINARVAALEEARKPEQAAALACAPQAPRRVGPVAGRPHCHRDGPA